MKLFIIQNRITKLCSTGGCVSEFKINGKVWTGIGAVKNHLNQSVSWSVNNDKTIDFYKNSDLIEIDTENFEKIIHKDFCVNYLNEKFAELNKEKSLLSSKTKV